METVVKRLVPSFLRLWNTLVSFFVAKKAGALRFMLDARASNRHFLRPPSGPLLTGEGLCHVEFQGTPEDAQNWFVASPDVKNAFHQRCTAPDGSKRLHCPLFSHAKLVTLDKESNENVLLPTL